MFSWHTYRMDSCANAWNCVGLLLETTSDARMARPTTCAVHHSARSSWHITDDLGGLLTCYSIYQTSSRERMHKHGFPISDTRRPHSRSSWPTVISHRTSRLRPRLRFSGCSRRTSLASRASPLARTVSSTLSSGQGQALPCNETGHGHV